MVRIFIVSILIFIVNIGFSQSVTTTYNIGDIPTDINASSAGCNEIELNITLPAGPSITVTGVDVAYDFTAVSPAWMSDQRSSILFPGQSSAPIISGVGNSSGTSNNQFLGETAANGTYPGGHILNFVFSAYRTFGVGTPSCNTTFNKIDNNTLTITVHYGVDDEEGSVGIGTDTPDNSALLEMQSSQKGFLPPRMTSALMNAISNPVEGLMVYCTDCQPTGMYSRVGSDWTTGDSNSPFILVGDLIRQNSSSFNKDFVFGRIDIPDNTAISDTMMFFDYSKSAFRGGTVLNNNFFGDDNVGDYSFAFGRNVNASGYGAIGLGMFVSATGDNSFAAGTSADATGYAAVALGEGSASGYLSFAAGSSSAQAENSVAMGSNTIASGDYSTALGTGTYARSWGETVIGTYSTDYTPQSTFVYDASDRLFVVGRGSSSGNRNNALTVMKNGNMGINVSEPESALDVNGSINVRGSGIIELNSASSIKEATAGRLSYPNYAGPVILTGGGSTLTNRRVAIQAKGGLDVDGSIKIQNDYNFRMEKAIGQTTVEIVASEGPGEGSQMVLYNDLGHQTIEIDGDFGSSKVGRIRLDEIEIKGGSDLAEYFDSNEKVGQMECGMLVCIDEKSEGKMKLCDSARDKKVLGVISGANGINPGMIMGQEGSIANGDFPIALLGRVYVKSNNENGEIEVGDFLTSSSKKGEAMRVKNFQKAQGAILGKVLTKRNPQTGFVLVLVNLQ